MPPPGSSSRAIPHTPPADHLASELAAFAGFLAGLPALIRRRMTVGEAKAIVAERLRHREAHFLAVLERAVLGRPTGPYAALMAMAGCTLDDVRALVTSDGLDGALRHLRQAGVYVSFEEFKGRVPIVRGSTTIHATAADFDNPVGGRYYTTTTGGSTGPGRRVLLDLAYLEAQLPGRVLVRHVQGITGVPAASWSDLPPGGGLKGVLLHAAAGEPATHWCCARLNGPDRAPLRYRIATTAALAVARASGGAVTWPRHLPFDAAIELARWGRAMADRHGRCSIHASVSRILRVAVAARDARVDLTGVVLRGGGEPPTPAKVAQITATGATFHSSYSFTEVGTVGSSCLRASGPNDQHFMQDHVAVIQAARSVPGFAVDVPAFCFTTLLPTAPKLLINVESDDYGAVDTTPCGCPWEQLGFPVHLRDIRSFGKLTGEGVTLVGSTIERLLDDALPARFGGTALDYQLAEEEDAGGLTRLILRVAPSVPLADDSAVVAFLLDGLAAAGGDASMAQATWRRAGSVRVRRERPVMTARGKLMPLDLRARIP